MANEHHHHHGAGTDDSDLAELLDLDAEVLHEHLSDVTGWAVGLAGDLSGGLILDLGSGTGSGTFALLRHADGARVAAIDASPSMLERVRAKAAALGVAERVRPVQADLDAGWPDVERADLVWASASLHHVADPDRTLREILGGLRPGGLLAVVELDSFPRFLPDDVGIGKPGLEERCHAVRDAERAEAMPHMGADWGAYLARAGFVVEERRDFAIELKPQVPEAAVRYAEASLRRMRPGLEDRLSTEDLAALDVLLDGERPECIRRRGDLTVRARRTAWAGRRP